MNEDLEKSLGLIKEVCAVFNGNLNQHENIQRALKNIEAGLQSPEGLQSPLDGELNEE